MNEYVYLIRATRPGFAEGSTPEEDAAMSAHFQYLKGLLAEGTLILAGPCLDTAFGVVIFRAQSLEDARRIMESDPSVMSGVMGAELHEFRVSLLQKGYERHGRPAKIEKGAEVANIQIKEVTLDNLRAVTKLKVADSQAGFVADNTQSLAWSRYLPNLVPSAIYNDDEIVGFVLYGDWGEENPGVWGIARFMIDERFQGKGYGKAAMLEVLRLIRERAPAALAVNLSYVPQNEGARKLYASVGFKETGEMWGDEVSAQYDFPDAQAEAEGNPQGVEAAAEPPQSQEGSEIKYATLVHADRERVYDAFTTAEGLDAWFTQGARVDARPGGEIFFRWVDWGPDHDTIDIKGEVIEAQRPERFVYTWYETDPAEATTVATTFEARDDGTVVRLREYGYPDTPEGYKSMVEVAAGWGEALTLLKVYAEHGVRY